MQPVSSGRHTGPVTSTPSKHVTIDAPDSRTGLPALSAVHDGGARTAGDAQPDVRESAPTYAPRRFPPEPVRKLTQEKLLGIPKHQPQPQYSGTRTYNYEEKYPPDELGKESGPEARVWRMYLDEAESYDEDMLRSFRDTIDSSLVLAALFAAIVATLIAQTSLSLKPDYGKLTVMLLVEQGKFLRAAGNQTLIDEIIQGSKNVNEETPTLTNTDIWVNGLFFASLALTLATALFSVLVKQWLQAYMGLLSGSAMDRALIRQFRFDGLTKWKLSTIVNALPLLLHTAFAVFLVGLSLFVYDLRPSLSWIVVAITALSFGAYFGSIMLPALWLECPYRIPLLFKLARAIVWTPTFVRYSVRRGWAALTHRAALSVPPINIPTLWAAEKEHLRSQPTIESWEYPAWTNRDGLLCRCLSWMHAFSSNKSIHRVATQAFHGILTAEYVYLDRTSSEWRMTWSQIPRCRTLLDSLPIPSFVGTVWDSYLEDDDPEAPSSFAHLWLRLLKMLRVTPESEALVLDTPSSEACTKQLLRSCLDGKVPFARTMIQWSANVNALNADGEPPLSITSRLGYLDLARLLLEMGANINAVAGSFGTALQAASFNGHLEIVSHLVEKRAALNIVGGRYGTALQAASLGGHLNVVRLLIENGADLDATDRHSRTALQAASLVGHLEIVKLLIEKGADLDAVGKDHGSALQVASSHGHLEIVRFLLDKGADVDAGGGRYGSALNAALNSKYSNPGVANLLREYGARDPGIE